MPRSLSDYIKDRTGDRIGRLTIVKPCGFTPQGRAIWQMRCDCGNVIERAYYDRPNQSCGCLAREITSARSKTHGVSRANDSTYKVWIQMRRRCRERDEYAGRGIKVCSRWENFENFLTDMGPKPPGTQLDRYPNNDGDYEPGNCRWATPKQNSNNRRSSFLIAHEGVTHSAQEWAEITGIQSQTIRWRLKRGWTVERALER